MASEIPSSTFLHSVQETGWFGTSAPTAGTSQQDRHDFSKTNNFGTLEQFLVKNFQQMTKNFDQMKTVHQETNRVLNAHNEQLQEVRKYVDEIGQANRNEVNRLKHEVNHFREQCNIRLENLETRTPSTHALGTRKTTVKPTDSHLYSRVAPSIDGPFQPQASTPQASGPSVLRTVPKKGQGLRKTSIQRKQCPYCGKSLKKSYLWKHKKYHCSAAREYSDLRSGSGPSALDSRPLNQTSI